MRRADRLFQIVQNLHPRRVTTAKQLAEELEVSERTIYRDIQDLSISGVPITGEAGHGYRLLQGFQVPPLMFTEEELEALMLGARMVRAWTDKSLAQSAHRAIQKIEHVIPERLKPELERNEIIVPYYPDEGMAGDEMTIIRRAIKQRIKLVVKYTRQDGTQSKRTLWPLGLFYWGKVWTLAAWCELRDEFRNFRLDRIEQIITLSSQFDSEQGKTLQDFLDRECP